MKWIDEDILGKITQFRKKHVIVGEKFGRRFVDIGYKNLDEIRERIAPYIIRRLKKDVAPDLPDMLHSTVRADMTGKQKELYDVISEDMKLLQQEIQEEHANMSEADALAGKKAENEDKLLGYMYMQQAVANHPLLLAQGKSKMAKKYLPLVRECRTSPKLDELIETMIPVLERGSKIVIFSKYVSMLQLIRERIMNEFGQEPYMIYGAIDSKERNDRLQDFKTNSKRQIMLLSDAGNNGLNIQEADTLIHFEQHWNPAIMAQRDGRIHRLDSDHESVDIITMITNETIDEQIYKTLEKKREIGDSLIERDDIEKEIMQELMEEA